jgi:WD40 repeat protein
MMSYKQLQVVEAGGSFPVGVMFSPDYQQIAIGGESGIRIRTYSETSAMENPLWYFRDIAVGAFTWNSQGTQIVFATQVFPSIVNPSRKSYARVYIIDQNGNELQHFVTQDTSTIYGIDISLDDRLIATHSLEGVITVWEAQTGTSLAIYRGTDLYPAHTKFSPYGGKLAYSVNVPLSAPLSDPGLVGSGVSIVVPVASIKRLNDIAKLCDNNKSSTQSQNTLFSIDSMGKLTVSDLPNFITQVKALPADTIPPACAADLIAVAEAIIAQPS